MINNIEGESSSTPESERISDLRKLANRENWASSSARILMLLAEDVGIKIPVELKQKLIASEAPVDEEVREFIAKEAGRILESESK